MGIVETPEATFLVRSKMECGYACRNSETSAAQGIAADKNVRAPGHRGRPRSQVREGRGRKEIILRGYPILW